MSSKRDDTHQHQPPRQPRSPQKASTLLLDDTSGTSLTKGRSTEIAAVSLTADSAQADSGVKADQYGIPTLEPTLELEAAKTYARSTEAEGDIQAASLKSSQLHYLQVNDTVATEALENAKTAARILEEAKATQLAVHQNKEIVSQDTAQAQQHIDDIEQGLQRSQKIVRESNFIHNEIKRIHAKIEKQSNDADFSTKAKEVDSLIASLHKSRSILDTLCEKAQEHQESAHKSQQELQKELSACTSIRLRLEKHEIQQKEFETSQVQLKSLTDKAMSFLEQSEKNLSSSKQGQTSYIAVSREINALRKELKTQKAQTSHLSADMETANKAIAQNTNAVEALVSDMKNVQTALESTKNAVVTEEDPSSKQALEKLLSDTLAAQKRMSQLLQLNNSVSDRITKIDGSITKKFNQQEQMAGEQSQALSDIQQHRTAIKRLIDQASRSHTLIVSACKKTSTLAAQVETSAAQEQEYKAAVLKMLQEGQAQGETLKALQSQLTETDQQHRTSLEQLSKTKLSLSHTMKHTDEQHQFVTQALTQIQTNIPIVERQRQELDEMLLSLEKITTSNHEKYVDLLQLEETLGNSLESYEKTTDQLHSQIHEQLETHSDALSEIQTQQIRLKDLEADFSSHIDNIEGLSTSIRERMQALVTQHKTTESVNKELDLAKTELRYLKEQCDQLLKECIDQSAHTKRHDASAKKSIQTLENIEKTVSQSLETQKNQEVGLDQLNTLVNNALNDLNAKLDQFETIEEKSRSQQDQAQQLHDTISIQKTDQVALSKRLNTTIKTIEKHLKSARENEKKMAELEDSLSKKEQQQELLYETQQERVEEQKNIIESQLRLMDDVKKTHDDTQKSLKTIEQIRKKAQQSFAHLGTQKNKFEQAFEQAAQKIQHQEEYQAQQQALLEKTQNMMEKLQSSMTKAQEFASDQEAKNALLDEKLEKIDEYQSRAFQAQQSTHARELQLEEKYNQLEDHITHFQRLMEKLDGTRLEEAQFRDELRALVHSQERQQKAMVSQLSESQDQHDALSKSLEDAHLMFRENKLATKESQMANRETKLILQDIRREISQLKETGMKGSQGRDWAAEERIDALTAQLDQEPQETEEKSRKAPPYTPSSFML